MIYIKYNNSKNAKKCQKISVSSFIQLILVLAIGLCMYITMTENSIKKPKFVANDPRNKITYILDWRIHRPDKVLSSSNYIVAATNVSCQLYPNCFLTNDMELLPDAGHFDAVLFHGMMLHSLKWHNLPGKRLTKQKYIFATRESAPNFPICDPYYDEYFNWTLTYRLDSDLLWGYIMIYDLQGKLIGPKSNMSWLPFHEPITNELRKKLRTKTKTAAWFVSHCPTSNKRENFVKEVSIELKRYDLTVDIYGKCSGQSVQKSRLCPKNHWYCNNMIEKDYYFYFAFENSFDKDYVTEKVLTAFNNLAVPVVYGGANYSRFLPPGSYLDGRALGAELLARTIRDIIQNRSRYEDMFRWRNHYQYKDSYFLMDLCNVCAKLNDPEEMARVTVYHKFRDWWNRDPELCKNWRGIKDV